MSYFAMENATLLGYEILTIGNPSLRKQSQKIDIDCIRSEDFKQFLKNMLYTLNASGGVGLAAPQVGVNIELFITSIPISCEKRYRFCKIQPLQVWINPIYQIADKEDLGGIEGCLSIPGYVGRVLRPKKIIVESINENGEENSVELKGWNARVFLHEYDHLKGNLYIDKLDNDYSGNIELYEKNAWTAIENDKRQTKNTKWLRNYGLKDNID